MKNIDLVIPVYNTPIPFLDECFESVLAQTYPNFTLFAIDDGSNEACANRLDEWASRDSRIRVVHKQNAGVSAARNLGIQMGTGEFISFVDADDILHHGFLEELNRSQVEANLDIAVCGYTKFGNGFSEENLFNWEKGDYRVYDGSQRTELLSHILTRATCTELRDSSIGIPWGKLYRRQLIENITFSELLPMGEDVIFNLNAFLSANKIGILNCALYWYRQNAESAFHRYRPDAPKRMMDFMQEAKYFVEMHPSLQLKDAYYIRAVQMFSAAMTQSICHNQFPVFKGMRECCSFSKEEIVANAFENVQPQKFNTPKSNKILIYLVRHRMFVLICILYRLRAIYKRQKVH
jgi:Glycosyltransferases, probably involved in cell wall biogenesis